VIGPPRPPRLAAWLLRHVLPSQTAEPIVGDLDELFLLDRVPRLGARAARHWYWRQVLDLIAARLFWQPVARPSQQRRLDPMAAIRQDTVHAIRSMRAQPGFTAVAVLTLALGLGANVAIFSLVHAVLLKPLPFREPGELALVHLLAPERGSPGVFGQFVWSFPKYQVLRDRQQVFSGTALYRWYEWSLTGVSNPERLRGEIVEASYFDVLGIAARVGRTFGPEENRAPGSEPVAIIGHGLWQRRYGGDPNVVGKTIGLDRIPHTIVGVAPAGFQGLDGPAEVWVPLMTQPAEDLGEAFVHSYLLVARRRPGISASQAEAAVRVLGSQIHAHFPDRVRGADWSATVVPLDAERVDPGVRRLVLVLLGAVALVLLIGCVNLANLMFARGLARQREVAIRVALGASRLRIVQQFMTESLLLSATGTLGGVILAAGSVRLTAAMMPDTRGILRGPQRLMRVGVGMLGIDLTVVMFTVGLALLTAVLFGLAPAWRAARRDVSSTIKVGGTGSMSAGFRRIGVRNVLVASEIALALVMLVAAGLMVKSVANLSGTDLGFRPDRLVTFRVSVPEAQYDPARAVQLFQQLLDRLRQRREIEAVAYGHCAPISGGCNGTLARFPDRPPVERGTEPLVGIIWVTPEYFSTLGIRLLTGRPFTDRDRQGQPKVVIVNETAARRFWKGENPIGKRLALGRGGYGDGAEVIGVVADVRYRTVETAPRPDAYVSLLQSPRQEGLFFVRSRLGSSALVPLLRGEVQALDADLPLIDLKTMDEQYGEATWRTWTSATLLGLFAVLALVLATLGIFGVLAQTVAERRREIGVRMALGAERGDVLRLVLARAALVASAGIVAGLAVSYFAMRLLAALLYDVQPHDPLVLGLLSLVLFAVAMTASYVPARRATRVDPLETLRAE
jgi:putative ABC transport system permease protein